MVPPLVLPVIRWRNPLEELLPVAREFGDADNVQLQLCIAHVNALVTSALLAIDEVRKVLEHHPATTSSATVGHSDVAVTDIHRSFGNAAGQRGRHDDHIREDYEKMQSWERKVDEMGKASGVLAPMIFASNVYVAPINSMVSIFSLVGFSCALSGLLAGVIKNVAAPNPKDHNVKATIVYLHYIFTTCFIMLCISASSLVGAVLAAFDRHHTNTNTNTQPTMIKAPISISLCVVPICVTIIACWLSRMVAIRKCATFTCLPR